LLHQINVNYWHYLLYRFWVGGDRGGDEHHGEGGDNFYD
jgi:hypothetical protein